MPGVIAKIKNAKKALKSAIKSYIKAKLRQILTPPPFLPPARDSMIIFRFDGIGDFVLFSPFITTICESFPNYRISLLLSDTSIPIAKSLHSDKIDNFIALNVDRFWHDVMYKVRFLRNLKAQKFAIALNPTFSRNTLTAEIVQYINAREFIAPFGDCVNLTQDVKLADDKFYTRLTPCENAVMFEFYRNFEFIKAVCGAVKMPEPRLEANKLPPLEAVFNALRCDNMAKQTYCVLFIGASAEYRKWAWENFAHIGAYLAQKYCQNIIICSGREDRENGEKIRAKILALLESRATLETKPKDLSLHSPIILNTCGLISLAQLATLVGNASLVVSNETSCAHFSVFLDTSVVVIYNRNLFGRFIPYPRELSDKYHAVLHPSIKRNTSHLDDTAYDIDEISTDSVKDMIDSILGTK